MSNYNDSVAEELAAKIAGRLGENVTQEIRAGFITGMLAGLFRRVHVAINKRDLIQNIDQISHTPHIWHAKMTRNFNSALSRLKARRIFWVDPKRTLAEFEFLTQQITPFVTLHMEGQGAYWMGYYFKYSTEVEAGFDAARNAEETDGYDEKMANTSWADIPFPKEVTSPKMVRRTVTLDDETMALAAAHGTSASDGIRALVRIGAARVAELEKKP